MKKLTESMFIAGVVAVTYGMYLLHPGIGIAFGGIAVIAFSALLNWKPNP